MFIKEVVVMNQVGLRARPATFLPRRQTSLSAAFGSKRMNAELTLRAFLACFLSGS